MDKPLKDIVKEKMDSLGMTPQDLERETGIPSARIYKWYSKTKPANPKDADSKTLRKWLGESSESSNVPKETSTTYVEQPLIQVVLNLTYIGKKNADSMDRMTISMDKMADSNLQNSKSIATLVNLIASNSDLLAQLTSLPTDPHTDSGLPVEAFLGGGSAGKGRKPGPQKGSSGSGKDN